MTKVHLEDQLREVLQTRHLEDETVEAAIATLIARSPKWMERRILRLAEKMLGQC